MTPFRLYIVLRSTLSAGLKMAQAFHAGRKFFGEYPHIDRYWYVESNNVAILETIDPDALADQLEAEGFKLSRFYEPDLDDQLTGFCVEPKAWRRLSNLPLAKASVELNRAA